ncbi:MAG: PQQ-binding-like beta-propeller repeat protein [Propionibacteriales bacterium]|nr:PQQ-binding-like beta-propeller repeat protein [Propionibacteriales bacterium]
MGTPGKVPRFRIAAAALLVLTAGCATSREPGTSAVHGSGPVNFSAQHRASRLATAGSDSWLGYPRDGRRSGGDARADQASGRLTRAWSRTLDGAVYGEPLVVDGRVIAVTENDSVYALSTDGRILWRQSIGTPADSPSSRCGNLDPLGSASGAVYDPASGNLLVVAGLPSPVRHRVFALDPATGRVRWSRAVDDETGTDRSVQQQSAALAIADGGLWVAFSALAGDCGPADAAVRARPPADSRRDTAVTSTVNRIVSVLGPGDMANDNQADGDLGSTGPVIVRVMGRLWIFADGKSGEGHLLRSGRVGAPPVPSGGAQWTVKGGRLLQLRPRTGRTVATVSVGQTPPLAMPTLHASLVLVGTLSGVTAVRMS